MAGRKNRLLRVNSRVSLQITGCHNNSRLSQDPDPDPDKGFFMTKKTFCFTKAVVHVFLNPLQPTGNSLNMKFLLFFWWGGGGTILPGLNPDTMVHLYPDSIRIQSTGHRNDKMFLLKVRTHEGNYGN
jgi:hypothetical protein